MKKKIIAAIIILLLLAGIGYGLYAYFWAQEENPDQLTLYGNVDIREVELAFKVSDRIEEIRVEEGEQVEKGQILAVLDTRQLEQNLARAQARLEAQEMEVEKLLSGTRRQEIDKAKAETAAAETEARNAQKTYSRLKPLGPENLASRERIDEARFRAEAAESRLSATKESLNMAQEGPREEDIGAAEATGRVYEAEMNLARQNFEDATLRAPSDAVIRNRILQPGDMASPQRPVLTLALMKRVWVRAYVSEPDLGKIFPGMHADVSTDTYPEKTYTGWVGYISPTAEFTPKSVQTEEVRTRLVYQVRVNVCNPNNELRLGMPATVSIPLDQPKENTSPPRCREAG